MSKNQAPAINAETIAEFFPLFLEEAFDILEDWSNICIAIESDPSDENLDTLFRVVHNLKGCSRSVGLTIYGSFVHEVEEVISLLRNKTLSFDPSIISFLLDCQTILVDWTSHLSEDTEFEPDLTAAAEFIAIVVPSKVTQRPGHQPSANQPASEPNDDIFADDDVVIVSMPPKRTRLTEETKATQPTIIHNVETQRVSTGKLHHLMLSISELAIQNEILYNALDENTLYSQLSVESIELIYKGIKELQDIALALRMQPLDGLFKRLVRTASDIARKQEKKIQVNLVSQDVELDRSIMEKIKDPLIHILRNAVDHGIELPKTRIGLDKAETATIKIKALQRADGVTITIEDDGIGLDLEKIHKKALKCNIIDQHDHFDMAVAAKLIMHPGFSTSDIVSDISGRGVGMDVVRKEIEALGGFITISSVEEQGTTFELTLPTKLSIVNALVLSIGKEKYSIPVQSIREVIDLSDYHLIKSDDDACMFSFRQKIIPIESLSDYLPSATKGENLSIQAFGNWGIHDNMGHQIALISEYQDSVVAFQVDGIIGQQDIVIRPLENHMHNIPGIVGSTILSTGEPSLIIDLPAVTHQYIEWNKGLVA